MVERLIPFDVAAKAQHETAMNDLRQRIAVKLVTRFEACLREVERSGCRHDRAEQIEMAAALAVAWLRTKRDRYGGGAAGLPMDL